MEPIPSRQYCTWIGVVRFQINLQLMSEDERQQLLAEGKHASPYVGVLLPGQGYKKTNDTRWVFPRTVGVDHEVTWQMARSHATVVAVRCLFESYDGAKSIGAVQFLGPAEAPGPPPVETESVERRDPAGNAPRVGGHQPLPRPWPQPPGASLPYRERSPRWHPSS